MAETGYKGRKKLWNCKIFLETVTEADHHRAGEVADKGGNVEVESFELEPGAEREVGREDGLAAVGVAHAGKHHVVPGILRTHAGPKAALEEEVALQRGPDAVLPESDVISGGESDVPFSNKAWVLIRKGGAAQSIKLKYSKLNVVYNRQSFTIPTDAEFSYIPVGL